MREGGLWSGLAVTDSPASSDAVPWAAARLTAEFGMGSGVSRGLWPPGRIRAPHLGPSRQGRRAGQGRIRRLAAPPRAKARARRASRSSRVPGQACGGQGAGDVSPREGCACFPSGRGLALCALAAGLPVTGSDQANRTISTGQLSASPRLHPRPIDVVVCHGPHGRLGFEGGFPLRCLQRLSRPFMATRHCRGRDNRSTSGTFTPVLSY